MEGPTAKGGLALRLRGLWQRVTVPSLVVLLLPPLLAVNGLVSQLLGDSVPGAAFAFGALKDLLLIGLLCWSLRFGRVWVLPPLVTGLVIAYVLTGAVSALGAEAPLGAAYGWRNDFGPALLLLAATPVFLERRTRERWVDVVAWTAFLSSIVLIVTWAIGLDWLLRLGLLPPAPGEEFPNSYFSVGEIQPRGFSPWVAPNQAGVALVMMIAVIALGSGRRLRWRWAAAALPVVAIVLTSSRSAWLGLAVIGFGLLGLLAWRRWGHRVALVTAAASLAALGMGAWYYFAASGRMTSDPSLGGHSDSLGEAVAMVRERPWGWGLGDVGPRSSLYGGEGILVESYWMLIALEGGLLAVSLFLAIQVVVGVRLVRAGTVPALAGVLVIAGSAVSQMVLPTFQEGAVVYLFWLGLAWALGAALSPGALDEPLSPRHRLARHA